MSAVIVFFGECCYQFVPLLLMLTPYAWCKCSLPDFFATPLCTLNIYIYFKLSNNVLGNGLMLNFKMLLVLRASLVTQ